MNFVNATIRLLIGGTFGIATALALSPAFAAFIGEDGNGSAALFFGVIFVGATLGMFAPTVRRAFGRGFLILGASVFALPISTFLLSGRVTPEVVATAEEGTEAFAAMGAGLGAVAVTGAATFIGVILGAILLIVGLILALGGRREVVVVERGRA